jgi:PHB/PHA accumulation regulator DNA-binding domain
MVTFKKYKNRKFYNKTASRYVNLPSILEVAKTEHVQVVDAVTGEDLTAETIVKAALESFTDFGLECLAIKALDLNSQLKVEDKPSTVHSENFTTVSTRILPSSKEEVDDLFSGTSN